MATKNKVVVETLPIPSESSLVQPEVVKKVLTDIYNMEVHTKYDAIVLIHLISALNHKDERLKKEAYAHLNKCVDCDEHEEAGLKVRKVTRNIRIPNESEIIDQLTAEIELTELRLKELKSKMEGAILLAGFTEEKGVPYYQAVKIKPNI